MKIPDKLAAGCSAGSAASQHTSPTYLSAAPACLSAVLVLSAVTVRYGVKRLHHVVESRRARERIQGALLEAGKRRRPITEIFRELSPVGTPEVNSRRFSAFSGLLHTKEPIRSPITGKECVLFVSTVLQRTTDSTFHTVASCTRVASSALRVVEQGEAWEYVLRGQVLEHGEAILRGVVTVAPPWRWEWRSFDPLASFVSEPSPEVPSRLGNYNETVGFHLTESQIVFHRELGAEDPQDELEAVLGVGHPFLAKRYSEHYAKHAGYVVIEAVVPVKQPVTVCGFATTPDKTMTILPTVVIEPEGMVMWCGTPQDAPGCCRGVTSQGIL